MKLQKDDPRLLQYVLNEISDQDRKVVEAAMFNQSDIAQEVQELKKLYLDISDVESQPSNLRLSAERREQLFAQTIDKKTAASWLSIFKNWRYTAGGLLAATFALMVFTHSLKKEVTQSAEISTARPTIPADSDFQAGGSGPSQAPKALNAPESMAQSAEEKPMIQAAEPSRARKTIEDEPKLQKDSLSEGASNKETEMAPAEAMYSDAPAQEDQAARDEAPVAESVEFADDHKAAAQPALAAPGAPPPPAQIAAAPSKSSDFAKAESRSELIDDSPQAAINENKAVAVNKEVSKKKLFTSYKQGGAIKTGPSLGSSAGANASATDSIETAGKGSNAGLLNAFGSGGVRQKLIIDKAASEKAKTAPVEKKSVGKLQVQISSRALESEQIKTMTATLTTCLSKHKVEREIKVEYTPQTGSYTITTANPTAVEKEFATCGQKAFVQLISPYIKIVYVELKAVP